MFFTSSHQNLFYFIFFKVWELKKIRKLYFFFIYSTMKMFLLITFWSMRSYHKKKKKCQTILKLFFFLISNFKELASLGKARKIWQLYWYTRYTRLTTQGETEWSVLYIFLNIYRYRTLSLKVYMHDLSA